MKAYTIIYSVSFSFFSGAKSCYPLYLLCSLSFPQEDAAAIRARAVA